jgi:hypothetical protein
MLTDHKFNLIRVVDMEVICPDGRDSRKCIHFYHYMQMKLKRGVRKIVTIWGQFFAIGIANEAVITSSVH